MKTKAISANKPGYRTNDFSGLMRPNEVFIKLVKNEKHVLT